MAQPKTDADRDIRLHTFEILVAIEHIRGLQMAVDIMTGSLTKAFPSFAESESLPIVLAVMLERIETVEHHGVLLDLILDTRKSNKMSGVGQ